MWNLKFILAFLLFFSLLRMLWWSFKKIEAEEFDQMYTFAEPLSQKAEVPEFVQRKNSDSYLPLPNLYLEKILLYQARIISSSIHVASHMYHWAYLNIVSSAHSDKDLYQRLFQSNLYHYKNYILWESFFASGHHKQARTWTSIHSLSL